MPQNEPMNKIRVRLAPSPTGSLHIGTLRTYLYDYLFARQQGGKVVIRIEDTDQKREVEGAVDKLKETLQWSGLEYDEGLEKEGPFGPYTQSKRLDLYNKFVQELIEKGSAYYAFDTAEEIEAMRNKQQAEKRPPMYDRESMKNQLSLGKEKTEELLKSGTPHVVRLLVPEGRKITFIDLVRGEVTINSDTIDDQILMKSDGFPTYHLAVVVDDHLMEISHVFRGEEWIASTPKHILIYEAFGWEAPQYAHLPLLLNADRSKLSKRKGDVSVESYIQKGYLRDALLNFIVLLGWNPKTEQEIMTVPEMLEKFDIKSVHKAGAIVDWKRLNWFNSYYIKQLSDGEFLKHAKPFLDKINGDAKKIQRLALLHKDRLQYFAELPTYIEPLLTYTENYTADDLIWKKSNPEETTRVFAEALRVLEETPEAGYTKENLEKILKQSMETMGIGAGNFFWPLRYGLSGSKTSPGVFEMASAFKKEETMKRLTAAQKKLSDRG